MGGPERHPKIQAVALLARLEHTKRGPEGLQSLTEAGSHRGSSPKGWDHLLLLRSTTNSSGLQRGDWFSVTSNKLAVVGWFAFSSHL